MTRLQKLVLIVAVVISLSFAGLAVAQNISITIQLTNGSQAAVEVNIYMLAGGNKFSSGMPPTGTTDSTGTFAFPPGLLSSNKPHLQMEVYEVCVNGQKVVFIIPKGSEDQLPADTNDCKRRRIGGFYWDGGSTIVVNMVPGGGVTQTGGRTTGAPAAGGLVQLEVGVYSGGGVLDESTHSGAAFKFLADGAVLVRAGRFFIGPAFGGEVLQSTVIQRFGSMSGNATMPSTYGDLSAGMRTVRIVGRFKVPLGGGIGLNVDGGALVAHLAITQTLGFCGGSLGTGCATLAPTTTNDTHVGTTVGAQISRTVGRHAEAVVGWTYDRVDDGKVADLHANEVFIGFRIRIGLAK